MPHSKGFRRRRDERTGDPVPIGDVVDRLLAEEAFSRGMPIATLASRWSELVGDRLARAIEPVSLEHGVLVIRASDGPWGAQARFLAEAIRTKAEEALGEGSVTSVRVVVGEPRNRR